MLLDAKFAGPLQALSAAGGYQSTIVTPGYSASVGDAGRSAPGAVALSLMSYNLLAPPYRRHLTEVADGSWRPRVLEQIEEVAAADADIVGLQEFWHVSEPYVSLWRQFAAQHGYTLFISPRTNAKQDGCALLLRTAAAPEGRGVARSVGARSSNLVQLGERDTCFPKADKARGLCTCSLHDWGNRIVQVFDFSTQTPISPICRTPRFPISRNLIPFFGAESTYLISPPRHPFLPYVAHPFSPHLRI